MKSWTVLFDIDGTLMTSDGAGSNAMEVVAQSLYSIERIPEIAVHGRTDEGILIELFDKLGLPYEQHHQAFRDQYHQQLPQSLRSQNARLLPAVSQLLDQLAGIPHVELGILTGNMREAASLKLQHVAINHFFDFGGYGDRHADRCDVAGEAVKSAAERIGDRFDSEKVWVIGDTVNDIRCARSIGAKVIAVETGGDKPEALSAAQPDVQLPDLAAAKTWLESLQ